MSRRLAIGESVDVYLADLTRLAKLVAKVDEDWLKCAFVFGLPEEMKSQMHVACSMMAMSLAEVMEKARSLEASREACCVVAAKETRHRVERGGGRVRGRGIVPATIVDRMAMCLVCALIGKVVVQGKSDSVTSAALLDIWLRPAL